MFSEQHALERWMRGGDTSADVIARMGFSNAGRYGQDFVARRLVDDCATMSVDAELVSVLHDVRWLAPVILATDNMDCFATAFQASLARRRRPAPNQRALRLREWAQFCDGLVCSSDVGVLKAENPEKFFGATLRHFGLDFAEAVLIDDREDNCAAFRETGGTAMCFKRARDNIDDLAEALYAWLGWSRRQVQRSAALTYGD